MSKSRRDRKALHIRLTSCTRSQPASIHHETSLGVDGPVWTGIFATGSAVVEAVRERLEGVTDPWSSEA
jgi:hypothetical protein